VEDVHYGTIGIVLDNCDSWEIVPGQELNGTVIVKTVRAFKTNALILSLVGVEEKSLKD
jgi:hypothetical protein